MQLIWDKWLPEFRIFCLSEIKDSLSMWAHYSKNHQGVVIELNCIDYLSSPWLVAEPVIYKDSIPQLATEKEWVLSITGQKKLDLEKLVKEFQYVKKQEWQNEKEWRVVSFKRSNETGLFSDYSIHPLNFNAVYLGNNISKENRETILSLLTHDIEHVSAYDSVINHDKQIIEFKKIK